MKRILLLGIMCLFVREVSMAGPNRKNIESKKMKAEIDRIEKRVNEISKNIETRETPLLSDGILEAEISDMKLEKAESEVEYMKERVDYYKSVVRGVEREEEELKELKKLRIKRLSRIGSQALPKENKSF